MAHLTLVVQDREVRKFVLNSTVTTIGRAQDNDIVINNLALSRRHAEVVCRAGHYEVSDQGSQNGVFVNNERVRSPRPLKTSDTITMGSYQFVFSENQSQEPDLDAARRRRRPPVHEKPVRRAPSPPPPIRQENESALLVLKYNDMELQRVILSEGECLIGRAKECDIQIAERRLSRRHCTISLTSKGYTVNDLGSQNGTYVNRKKVRDEHVLSPGDVLNFAEYSVVFLAGHDEYDGPDSVHDDDHRAPVSEAPLSAHRPDSHLEAEQTEFPEVYSEDQVHGQMPQPSIISEPEAPEPVVERRRPRSPVVSRPSKDDEPFVERPGRARDRRGRAAPKSERAAKRLDGAKWPKSESSRGTPAPQQPQPQPEPSRNNPRRTLRPVQERPQVEKAQRRSPPPSVRPEFEHQDIDDEVVEQRPDPKLDDWYSAREDEYEEEPSVLLERSKSTMSQLLSTMMVDKRELDRNLQIQAKQRKFFVDVTWKNETIFSGHLTEQVTILGTDKEADIKLRGRYVAGRHSLLVRVRDSLLLVRLGSSSAARVNGLPKLQAFLKSGDVIQIDETTLKITEE